MEKEQKTSQEGQKDSSFHELWQQLPAHQINPVRWAGGMLALLVSMVVFTGHDALI